jgi:hypothetical protein
VTGEIENRDGEGVCCFLFLSSFDHFRRRTATHSWTLRDACQALGSASGLG